MMVRRLIVCAVTVASIAAWAFGCTPGAPARDQADTPGRSGQAQRLNNLVAQLARLRGPLTEKAELRFTNPRQGWIYIGAWSDAPDGVRLTLDTKAIPSRIVGSDAAQNAIVESMRFLRAGMHTVEVVADGGATIDSVVVRAIPELIFCKYGYHPHVPEYGPYDWDFLKRHVLPHTNTVIGNGSPEQAEQMAEWKALGGRWLVECPTPGYSADSISSDEVFEAWAASIGMQDSLSDGIIVDEFHENDSPKYAAWSDGVRRLRDAFPDKTFYPYFGSPTMSKYEGSKGFIGAVFEAGGVVAWERYMFERYDREVGERMIERRVDRYMGDWIATYPGCAAQMIACLGYLTITESLDIHPSVDYKVFMDIQFQHLATAPQFDGLRGIMEYTSGYADEETVRWAARLYRHYGIEGNTGLLSDRYGFAYRLNHIDNPDFAMGTEGWHVEAAGHWLDCAGRSMDGYSHLQGRMPTTTAGDSFLRMKRYEARPNTVSQNIVGLVPGRLYSAKMISGDYGELVAGSSEPKKHGVVLRIDGAEELADKSFQSVVPNNYAHGSEAFNRSNRYWFNYHRVVFRAAADTATISISDWQDAETPGGPVGQELIVNFVEVQPYYWEWKPLPVVGSDAHSR